MKIKTIPAIPWHVRVHRNGKSIWLGTVVETSEINARNAALSRFSRTEDEPATEQAIGPDDDFDVSPT